MKELLKKILYVLRIRTHWVCDKLTTTKLEAEDVKRQIEEKIQNTKRRHCNNGIHMKKMIAEKETLSSRMETHKRKASEYKTSGQEDFARRELQLYLKYKEQLDGVDSIVKQLEEKGQNLELSVANFEQEKRFIESDIELLESRERVAKDTIYQAEKIDNVFDESDSFRNRIEAIRKKVEGFEDHAVAITETQKAFSKDESRPVETNDEVEKLLKEL